MPTTLPLPDCIQSLLDRGLIRRVDETEFVIDGLRHRERSYLGWSTVIYSLRIEEYAEGAVLYEIIEETEDAGEEDMIASADPEDAAYWIENMIEEMARET